MPVPTEELTPNLKSFLASLKGRPVNTSVENLATLFRRRQISAARRCALATANLMINVVAAHRSKDPSDLVSRVRTVSQRLVHAQPYELAIGNVCRRVLGLIRDASDNTKAADDALDGHSAAADGHKADPQSTVKEDVLDGIRELLDELDQADKQISEYSNEHVYPEESILIFGGSHTVQRFLLDASKRRKFRVFAVEDQTYGASLTHETVMQGTPRNIDEPSSNQNRLKSLTSAGIQVTIIPDSQVFAIMSRISKVLLSAQGTLSNGGCVVPCGSKNIAAAANYHHVPLLVLSPIYRLSPAFPYDPRSLLEQGDPTVNTDFRSGPVLDAVITTSFMRDFLPPHLVDIYVTNIGSSSPSQMYRLASDHYRKQDIDLEVL